MQRGLPKYITLEGAVKSIASHRGSNGWCLTDEEWAMELLEDVIENEADGSRDEGEEGTMPQMREKDSDMSR